MSTPNAAAMARSQEPSVTSASPDPRLDEVFQRACARIAPTWPLDRFIAVNPFWGLIDSRLPEVAARLQSLSGARLLMPRSWYRQAYREGRLRDEHLQAALDASDSTASLTHLRALLEQDEPAPTTRARVVDVVDAGRDLVHEASWRGFITQSVSQFCAGYFDEGQAQLGPPRDRGLYASWRQHAMTDRSPALLMRATSYRRHASALPATARELARTALAALEVPPREQENYLWSLLLEQNGWASWCAYRRWTARLQGSDDDTLHDLAAIRLAWEWMLYRAGGDAVARSWKTAMANWTQVDAAAAASRSSDWLLQAALEIAWREPVLRALPAGLRTPRRTAPSVQAVFCIDVRSEVFRRALEAIAPSAHTLGFAGFFGVPMDYQPLGAAAARPQLPGLLAPRLRASDTGLGPDAEARRAGHFDLAAAWRTFKTDALSTFTFVEALGLTYAGKLVRDSLGLGGAQRLDSVGLSREMDARRKPRVSGAVDGGPLEPEARCDLAAGMLRGMSLTHDFARFVLLVGHGSATRNNPHAAGLDCGACCGQTGEVNARAAAALLNEPEVRKGLAKRGIHVPESTWFVAALHHTTTDEVELFDVDESPPAYRVDLDALRAWLAEAGARARTERARLLGLEGVGPSRLHQAIRARTTDWAQVRAEWGLVNNAAFIVAPREHCRHLDLQGRAFLHEYRHQEDEGFAVLELIMTAPMVVTHWINFQYYASTVDNARYGSGDKVLHNVVGGHLGVFEGNGGDLRIGLPMQSVHDGERWVHTPLRLSVFIEAPRAAIAAVLDKHAHVQALVTNGWLSLFQIDEEECAIHALRGGRWHREAPSSDSAPTQRA
ncbi:YbcC family protein [Corallococcus caeni]|uniref:YbcC family protein n=1 Tax=Corallococcus caeni TaxID=3082388 RepID=UPI00295625F8|nr:YbcC family protein [Corallococcus sp. KH5-1]